MNNTTETNPLSSAKIENKIEIESSLNNKTDSTLEQKSKQGNIENLLIIKSFLYKYIFYF